MATIEFTKNPTQIDKWQFTINVTDKSDVRVLKAVLTATDGSGHGPSGSQEICNMSPTVENILALQATGFDWTIEALTNALKVLAEHIRKTR